MITISKSDGVTIGKHGVYWVRARDHGGAIDLVHEDRFERWALVDSTGSADDIAPMLGMEPWQLMEWAT